MSEPNNSKTGPAARHLILGAVGLAAAMGIAPLYNQVAGSQVATAARRGDLREMTQWEGRCLGRCPTSALVTAGAAYAQAAEVSRDETRGPRLAEAERRLTVATHAEPLNGEAWIQLAYVHGLRDIGPSPRLQAALRRSYEVNPFNPRGGAWRLKVMGAYWPLMAPDLRRAAAEEARWRWSVRAEERPAILAALPSPDARRALQVQLAAAPPRRY